MKEEENNGNMFNQSVGMLGTVAVFLNRLLGKMAKTAQSRS